MDDWRKRIADLVHTYFGTRSPSRSRVELFLRQLEPLVAGANVEIPAEVRDIISNLQTMTIVLRRSPSGEPVYVLREGRLAGELRTEAVRGKSPRELFPPEVNAITLPMVARAFDGEDVEFTYTLGGRTFLTLLHPFRRNDQGQVTEVLGSMVDVTTERQYALELEHSERLFRTLIENMPCGVLYEEFAPDGTLARIVVNSEFTQVTGYTLEAYQQITADQWSKRIHPDDYDAIDQTYHQWLDSGSTAPLHLQYRFLDRHGIERWLDNYLARIVHEDGCEGILQVVLDITERATAEQRLRHAASYLEQSIEPIVECDNDYVVTYLNRAAYAAFPEITVGSSIRAHPLAADLEQPGAIVQGQPQSTAISVGSKVFMRLVAPTERGWRLFCHDVTTLVEAEKALRRALEYEQTMNMLRTQFVSTLSHEFRTPLAGILTAAQLLDRYGDVMTSEQRRETTRSIAARVRDLEYIVQSFTRRSALLGRTDATMSEIDPAELIRQLAEEIEIIRRKHSPVTISGGIPERIQIDAELFRAALEVLLDNAARYSPEQSTIEVHLALADTNRLCVTLRDHGIGIPADEMDRLFLPYFRSSRTGNIPGSGLSLATLKPLIESVNGSLSLSNHPDGGMIARLELPCSVLASHVEHFSPTASE